MSGEYDWDAGWSVSSINGSNVADGASASTGAVSNDGQLATEVSIEISYGATVNQGVVVSLLRAVDGANFESATDDSPWSFEMTGSPSTTHRKAFTVPGDISEFQVHLANDSGAQVTATVRTRQAAAAA